MAADGRQLGIPTPRQGREWYHIDSMPAERAWTASGGRLVRAESLVSAPVAANNNAGAFLSNKGVTTFMVIAQNGMLGAMTSPVDASYLADSVVLLRYFEHGGSVKKAISVMKKRTGGHEDSIRQIWFDKSGIHLSEPLLQLRGVLTGVPTEIGGAGAGSGANALRMTRTES